jgi:hypothetical protein
MDAHVVHILETFDTASSDQSNVERIQRALASAGVEIDRDITFLSGEDTVHLSVPRRSGFCPGCGTQAIDGDHYCRRCGRDLAAVSLPRQVDNRNLGPADAPVAAPPDAPANGNGAPPVSGDGKGTVVGDGTAPNRARAWFRRHRKVLAAIGSAVVLGLAGASAYLLVLKPSSTAPQETETALAASASALERSIDSAARANRLVDVRRAGDSAADALLVLADQRQVVADLSSDRYRSAASAMLQAEHGYLRQLRRLEGLGPSRLGRWSGIKRRLQRAATGLAQALPAVRELELDHPAKVLPGLPVIDQAATELDSLITDAARRLAVWRDKLATAKAARASDLAEATSYSDALRGYLDQYDDLRSETDDWTQQVESVGATYDEAYQFLGDAAGARQTIHDSIAGLTAPGPLGGPQSRLESVLSTAVQAMSAASSGIATYQFDYSYTDYKQTPGWQEFQSASGEISDEYAAARAEWEGAIESYIASIESRPLPKRPVV